MQVDPVDSLAMSLQAAPDTFALLLGAGISRSAKIPTGWEVVNDLLRNLALLVDGDEPDDPIAWYQKQAGFEPDYSTVLEKLAPGAVDRRNLLNRYFEPTAEDREQGVKVPTQAHRAIAQLVAGGYVRVIVTTNFDRLLENAIRDAGIEPIVISSASAAAGATPLAHSKCTIIKVHGDYLDPDLKNTVNELGSYDPAIDRLLDRVFDEYGLIVCGWSAEWDAALRSAVLRTPVRRYSVWWAHRGDLGPYAQQLIDNRGARDVLIAGADEFFGTLANKVDALAVAMDRRPLSTALAVAELKRCIPDPVRRVRLYELIRDAVDVVVVRAPGDTQVQPTAASLLDRMHEFEAAMATAVALFGALAFFTDEPDHIRLMVTELKRVANRRRNFNNYSTWTNLELYPALLGLYAVGLGSLAASKLDPLMAVLTQIEVKGLNKPSPFVEAASSLRVLDTVACTQGMQTASRTPTSDYLHERLREPLRPVISSDDEYSDIFDQLEYLLGVVLAHAGHAPIGRFAWRREHHRSGQRDPDLDKQTPALLSAGLFGGSAENLEKARTEYEQAIERAGVWW